MRRLSVFATAALLASVATANAQSFNCHRAHYADEATICAQPDLARLDERLAAVFGRLNVALPPPDRPRLRQAEDNWVLARRQCGANHDCIVRAYQNRIDQLAALVPGAAPAAPEPAAAPGPVATAPPKIEKPANPPEKAARHSPMPSEEPAQQSGSSTPPAPAAANPPAANPASSGGGRPGAPTITWVDPPPSRK